MKFILILGATLFSFSLFAQQSSIVKLYNPDSTIMATGVIEGSSKEGLWKYYNPKTNQILSEGNFQNGQK